ncbi:twin-arginine translocase TatA/TatE family subunit [Microbacterium sp. NPDC087591]|uniref:twin-arginine translocase TatA/TatE family subunit n=1 Tax=Microbacterium sp. NPDC087591 TaxID=3364192 RepID=UPI0037FA7D40
MFAGMQGWHLLIVLAVILLLFGAAKLPALAKSMGQSARVFKGEMKAMKEEDADRADNVAVEPTTVKDSGTTPETPPRA